VIIIHFLVYNFFFLIFFFKFFFFIIFFLIFFFFIEDHLEREVKKDNLSYILDIIEMKTDDEFNQFETIYNEKRSLIFFDEINQIDFGWKILVFGFHNKKHKFFTIEK
jgi:hypothetical protein